MKRRPRLTAKERKALATVAQEFLAGHDAEMTMACGVADTEEQGAEFLALLTSAVEKL